jgi:hypothetical protein
MQFDNARPDVVRAVNQRWLLKFWTQHLAGQRVPQWQNLPVDRLSGFQENLSFLDVVRDAGDGMRFLIRFHGQTIRRAYASPDGRGRYLDEIVSAATCSTGLAPYEKAARDAMPVYTILEVSDRQGRSVNTERLLLPFGRDGDTADRLLAAFEFICDDGAFDGEALLQFTDSPTVRLAAQIEARP